MLQAQRIKTVVLAPGRVIFERRDADAYQLETSVLEAEPPLEGEEPVESAREVQETDLHMLAETVLEMTPALAGRFSCERPVEAVPGHEVAEQVRTEQVQFRQAVLEVDNADDFWAGVVGGQVAVVQEQWPLTGELIFELFEDALYDQEFSETWLVGYLLGLSDALLKHRKSYPREYAAQLKPLLSWKKP
ncbi:MAG TPA: hypothetical protein VGD98_17105 [Ktedonobacteraceae bacterium]